MPISGTEALWSLMHRETERGFQTETFKSVYEWLRAQSS